MFENTMIKELVPGKSQSQKVFLDARLRSRATVSAIGYVSSVFVTSRVDVGVRSMFLVEFLPALSSFIVSIRFISMPIMLLLFERAVVAVVMLFEEGSTVFRVADPKSVSLYYIRFLKKRKKRGGKGLGRTTYFKLVSLQSRARGSRRSC